jgi:short-subunit dehydrogenase involved in D-alanine esterification of teichoic acids
VSGGRVRRYGCHVGRRNEVEELVALVDYELEGVDVLINNPRMFRRHDAADRIDEIPLGTTSGARVTAVGGYLPSV